jgi:hypothetical protein
MRPRWSVIWLTVSAVLNLVLLVAWLAAIRPAPTPERFVARRTVVTNILRPIRTNVLFQPRLLSWKDIESDDYPTYVRNLRGIGCPPETVRDIIVADVNALFARRRAVEVPHAAQQWWRLEPDSELADLITTKTSELERERRDLLTRLLGSGWEEAIAAGEAPGAGDELSGPLLGDLTEEARRQVRAIERASRERAATLLREHGPGASLKAAESARLERETRARLAEVLNPEQLEEYLLRHSLTAQRLRAELKEVDVTPEEFRSLFKAMDALDAEKTELGEGSDPASRKRLAELERKEQAALEKEVGTARYVRLRLARDAVFRDTWNVAEKAGVAAEQVIPLYQVNQATIEERRRVLADDSLPPEEQTRRLAELYEQRLVALRALVGADAFQRLQALEQP